MESTINKNDLHYEQELYSTIGLFKDIYAYQIGKEKYETLRYFINKYSEVKFEKPLIFENIFAFSSIKNLYSFESPIIERRNPSLTENLLKINEKFYKKNRKNSDTKGGVSKINQRQIDEIHQLTEYELRRKYTTKIKFKYN